MDDKVRETIVTSFSRLVLQRCDDRLVDCAVEQKVPRNRSISLVISRCFFCFAGGLVLKLRIGWCLFFCSTRRRRRRATRADVAAGARDAVDDLVDGGGRAPGRRRDAGADERSGARRDGDGEADEGGDAVRAVPRRREPLAGGVRDGRRRLGRRPRAGQLH